MYIKSNNKYLQCANSFFRIIFEENLKLEIVVLRIYKNSLKTFLVINYNTITNHILIMYELSNFGYVLCSV